MQELIDKLVFSLLKKNSLAQCTTDELKNLAEQYPFFSTAQLLYACKLKHSEDPLFQTQLEKVSLYVSNPLWLEYVISNRSSMYPESETAKKSAQVFEEAENDEKVIHNVHHPISGDTKTVKETGNAGAEIYQSKSRKEPDTAALVFEPYHTVDYFASQGIRQKPDEKPTDKFSQQLKSFTEWLKTIRQMRPQQIAELSDSRSEEKVVQMAEVSIEDRNVVTETMAEVWIKQGHPEKAVEIYHKLSLLNPSKSSYFAGLIENLKQS